MFGFIHHYLLPHHKNNHRPNLLHHSTLVVLIGLLCLAAVITPMIKREYPAVLSISADISTQELLNETNKKRKEQGLTSLQYNAQLSQAAAMKAQHMFSENYWAHVAPDGTTPWVFIRRSGYEYLYAGENLARGYTTATDVIEAWMGSPSHRDNMLSPNYNEVGFAVANGQLTGSETVLVVEMFGTKYIETEQSTLSQTFPTPGSANMVTFEQFAAPLETAGAIQTAQLPKVEAIKNDPLIDSKSTSRNIAFFLLVLFILVLVIDAIVIERKKINRVVAHNLDHIIFLMALLFAAILIGKGAIL